ETSHRALQQSSAKANGTASLAMALLSASRIQFVRGDYGRSVRLAEQARDTLDPTPTSDFFTNALANDIRAHLAQLKAPQ
ncbi:MAG TPA: hypothetical protein PK156_34545, partial [Polyangium sp.]|nr:hypothetical protein [Polyangium sp.]